MEKPKTAQNVIPFPVKRSRRIMQNGKLSAWGTVIHFFKSIF